MIKEITSKSNEYIKSLIKLKQKKNRTNQFLIEGERFISEAIKRKISIKALLFTKTPEFIGEVKLECILITDEIAKMLSDTVTPSGIFAVIDYPMLKLAAPKANFLVLDNVSDPGNLGTIIRTALAFGFRDIYLYKCVDWRNPKVLRSTMGTVFDVNLYQIDLQDFDLLRNFALYAADMHGQNIFALSAKPKQCGVVLGNEGNGISPEVDRLVNKKLSIPMQNDVESLNVAIAGAIIMSQLTN